MATTLIQDENNESSPAMFGESEFLKVVTQKTFPELVFELLTEKSPTEAELKLFNLILNISIDHGPNTPSAVETIKAAKEGKTISESLAAGVLQINERHGGAIEPGMRFFYQVKQSFSSSKDGGNVQEMVDSFIEQKKIIGGFGHRIYEKEDPRAELILKELGEGEFVGIARQIQDAIEAKKGKRLVINVDGAIAAVLCTWGWDPKLGKAVFLIARAPGLIGQYLNHSNG